MPKLQLGFHTKLGLKKEDLIKILRAAAEEKGLNDSVESLMERTGLGNKKVGSMRGWAMRSGLVKDKFLTSEGKIILAKDPDLESPITDWLMHFYLSLGEKGLQIPPSVPADWGGWTYFIYTFLPQYRTFTSVDLVHTSALTFEQEATKNLIENFKYLLHAYTKNYALAGCKLLTQNGDQFVIDRPNLPNIHLVGYFLAKLWSRDFKDAKSVLTESILNHEMGLAPVLGISPAVAQEQLNTLETYGIIEQRRAVPPYQTIPHWDDPLTLLEKAYDADR